MRGLRKGLKRGKGREKLGNHIIFSKAKEIIK